VGRGYGLQPLARSHWAGLQDGRTTGLTGLQVLRLSVCHIRTFASGFPAIVLFGFCLFTVSAKMFVMLGVSCVCGVIRVGICVCLVGFRLSKPHTPGHNKHTHTHHPDHSDHPDHPDQFNT